jgi:hypothetical protein
MRDFILGLSVSAAFIIGCLAGGATSSTTMPSAQAAVANADGPRYEYKCVHTVSNNAGAERQATELTERLDALGTEGWKFESFMGPGYFYCATRERQS